MSRDSKPQQPNRHFQCDMAVSLREGVCLLRSDTKQWVFMRRIKKSGRLVPAEMPHRILKQLRQEQQVEQRVAA